jgi:hypothetical protein
MTIKIRDKEGGIEFKDSQFYSKDNLIRKYRNDLLTKRLLETQIEKAPSKIKEDESEIEIREQQMDIIQKRINKSEEIFKKRNINPKEEIKLLKEKYSEEELNKKAKNISEKQTFEIKDNGPNIERITKNVVTIEDELILYASNKYNLLQANEIIIQIRTQIEKTKERLRVQKEELEKVLDSIRSIELYFKKKRIDINKLLDEEAQERKKEQKMAQELKFGDKK